jgi:hypothetical protein
MMTLTPYVIVCVTLAAVTLGLALYRRLISSGERDILYLGQGEERNIPLQASLATRLAAIDKWGKVLTVVTIVLGTVLTAIYLYGIWVEFGTTLRFG